MKRKQVVVHRGIGFGTPNSLDSLLSSLREGFSVELDIHLLDGELVISHDPPFSNAKFDFFIEFVSEANRLTDSGQILAINVKQDGLAPFLQNINIKLGHFFFDMSTPQKIVFEKHGLPCATRFSEFEPFTTGIESEEPPWIWLDSFQGKPLENLAKLGKSPAKKVLVSPELHEFDADQFVPAAKKLMQVDENIFVCTDLCGSYF